MTQFTDLGLAAPILKALAAEGYVAPTPIQAQAIPPVMSGRDLLGIAQTGTGKTAAFALPILHRLATDRRRPEPKACRVLVLSPTRELASQIAESFRVYGKHLGLTIATVFGGVSGRPQTQALARGVDVVVATPGRLLDHMGTRAIRLDRTEILVLDEADQMLDMGFIVAIRKIVPTLPKVRQNLFFSATMPKEIDALAADLLRDPVHVAVTPIAKTADRVDQRIIFVETSRKRILLAELLADAAMSRTLVFTRTKHGADRVVKHLDEAGIPSAAIHGNKSQGQREKALASFKSGRTRVLIATDIAARGIDVDGVTHVVNFDLPNVPESYVHRIGRTARAGAEGIAISFCDGEERAFLRGIENLIRQRIPATDRREHGGGEHHRAETARQAPRGGHHRQGGRPQGERISGERISGERPQGDRATAPRPQGERSRPSYQPALRDASENREPAADMNNVGFMRPARPADQAAPFRKRPRNRARAGR